MIRVFGLSLHIFVLGAFWLGLALGGRAASATSIVAWGDNTYGQTNVPSGLTNAIAIAQGGYHGLAIKADGTVAAWGCNFDPFTSSNYVAQATPPVGLSNVVALAAGYDSSLALRGDGNVVVWGDNAQTNVPAEPSNVVAIAAGEFCSLALRGDGTVAGWGTSPYGLTNIPPGLSNVVAISIGGTDSVALLTNGLAVVWGWNGYNATNVPSTATNLAAVAAGLYHILALKADGTVIGWGYNGYGQTTVPAGLSNVVAIAAGWHHSLALKKDGTVVGWGYNNAGQTTIPKGLTNVVAIAASRYQSLALANDGSPWVLKPPANLTLYSGMNAAFSVTATGRAPLSYQWQFNGTNLAAATSAALALTNVQVFNSGNYRAVISNAPGAANSSAATLTVIDSPPIIVNQLTNQMVALKSNVSLVIFATGSLPLSYQWQFNGTNLARATNSVLTVTNAQWPSEGTYRVVVSNAFGAVVSSNMFLNVMDLAEALNTTNMVWTTSTGSAAWFAQGAVSHDGVAAAQSGASTFMSSSTLQTSVTGPGTLTFWGKATQFADVLAFTSTLAAPSMVYIVGPDWQPETAYLGKGSQTLQWRFNASPLGDSGLHAAWLDQLSFTPGGTAPFITSFPSDQAVLAGTNANFSLQAQGTPPFSYQWQFNGTNIAGATSTALALTDVQAYNEGIYSVVVSNAFGTTLSNTALTVVPTAPLIIAQPASQAILIRSNAIFQVAAQGSEPLTYQWQFNGTNLAGASDPSLILTNLQQSDAGTYQVLVSNAYGTTPSTNATLAVITSWIVAWGNNTYGQTTVPPNVINPIAIAVGDVHDVALNRDGTVVGWGFSGYGQANTPAELSNVVAIATEANDSLALRSDGTIAAWGWDFYGQTDAPPRLANVVQLAGGGFHSLALRGDGTVVAWGRPFEGQIDVPPGLTNVAVVSAGGFHSLAVKQDGTVVAWGDNSQGQCDVPAGLTNVVAIGGGSFLSLALVDDGTVVAWGASASVQANVPPGLTNVVAIDPAGYALRSDGTMVAWGDNSQGQTNVPPGLSNVVAFAGDALVTLALVNDGSPWIIRQPSSQTVYCGLNAVLKVTALGAPTLSYQWQCNGTNLDGATNAVLALTNVQRETQGQYSVVLSNALGMLTSSNATVTAVPPAPAVVFQPASQSVVPGGSVTFSMLASGLQPLSYQWRRNGIAINEATGSSLTLNGVQAGNLGSYDVVVSNAFGSATSSTAALTVAQVVAWGDSTYNQTNIPPGLSNVVAIASGFCHTLALKNDGTVEAWGAGTNNLLAIEDLGQTRIPEGLTNVKAISAGSYHSVALRKDGTVVAWGYGANGETNIPPEAANIEAIAAGYSHNIALRLDGRIIAWGSNTHGETNVPIGLSNVVAIAGGGYHNLALKQDGTVVAWGYNMNGEISVPAGLSNVVGIAAGGYHSLALKADGTLVAWGRNTEGESNVPSGLSNVVAVAGGLFHTVALKRDGTLVTWGYNNHGQTSFPIGLPASVSVSAGAYFSVALLNTGSPFFATQPTNQTLLSGQTATFQTAGWGSPPLVYQWQFNGINLDGANDATLSLSNVSLSRAGTYQCLASNLYGSILSLPVTLTVLRSTPQLDASPSSFQLSNGGFSLNLKQLSGHGTVIVYASSNLLNWNPVFTNPPVLGTLNYLDAAASNLPVRFYRAAEQ